ncbi:MAG: hypothetical protein ACXVP7_09680 [Actinomycetota bacterium]
MFTGPTQPEIGRQRVADGIRRARADERAATFIRARSEKRRARAGRAFNTLFAALRPRGATPPPQPIRTVAVDGR